MVPPRISRSRRVSGRCLREYRREDPKAVMSCEAGPHMLTDDDAIVTHRSNRAVDMRLPHGTLVYSPMGMRRDVPHSAFRLSPVEYHSCLASHSLSGIASV